MATFNYLITYIVIAYKRVTRLYGDIQTLILCVTYQIDY